MNTGRIPESIGDYVRLLGKERDSEEVQALLRGLGPGRRHEYEGLYFLVFLNDGIDLRFEAGDALTGIFFFPKGTAGHAAWTGPLPDGVSLDGRRGEILAALGRPAKSDGDDAVDRYDVWEKDGYRISITLRTRKPDDPEARVRDVCIAVAR